MFSRTVSVVAPVWASPSRPTSCTKTWKTRTSRNTWHPAGPPYFISRPKSSRSSRQPDRVSEFPAVSRPEEERQRQQGRRPRPGHRRPAGAGDPHSGNPSRPKIRTCARATFTAVPAASIPSTVQVWPRPEKNPLIAAITSIGRAAKRQAAQVGDLERLQGRGVAADGDQRRRGRDDQQEQEARPGRRNESPARRPVPPVAAGRRRCTGRRTSRHTRPSPGAGRTGARTTSRPGTTRPSRAGRARPAGWCPGTPGRS